MFDFSEMRPGLSRRASPSNFDPSISILFRTPGLSCPRPAKLMTFLPTQGNYGISTCSLLLRVASLCRSRGAAHLLSIIPYTCPLFAKWIRGPH